MGVIDSLSKRRSIYQLNKELPVSEDEVVKTIERATELVPDAFNMKSQRVAVVMDEQNKKLWDVIYNAFGGKVAREKIDSLTAAGTVLYFYDKSAFIELQKKFALYAEHFPTWAQQSNGMLQLAIWTALRDLNIGANLQHYNPIIDDAVRKMLDLPDSWVLVGQMPFGGIVAEPEAKPAEDIAKRVKIYR